MKILLEILRVEVDVYYDGAASAACDEGNFLGGLLSSGYDALLLLLLLSCSCYPKVNIRIIFFQDGGKS